MDEIESTSLLIGFGLTQLRLAVILKEIGEPLFNGRSANQGFNGLLLHSRDVYVQLSELY
jgi:hypothetical protein